MEEILCWGKTLPLAYHDTLSCLNEAPIVPCPDWNTNQKEVSMTMVVENPLQEPMISKLSFCDPSSLEQYCQEMLDGILDFEIQKGNWIYTYHDRLTNYYVDNYIKFPDTHSADQIKFVIDELKRNPYSRRAVVDIRDNSDDMYSNDPACWQHAQFFIRNHKLHMKVLFRSNDACKATFMNAFALILLQKRTADALGVEVGTYTHRANSFHCYEADFDMLNGYVNRIKKNSIENLTYFYESDWKDLMTEAQPEIARKVELLKKK